MLSLLRPAPATPVLDSAFNSVLFSLVNLNVHSIRVFADHPSLSPRPSQMDTANSDGMDEG